MVLYNGLLEVKDCKYGKGIFAGQCIPAHTLIEVSPIIVFSEVESVNYLYDTKLGMYLFGYDYNRTCLALGLGSLFNHSNKPNVEFGVYDEVIEFHTNKKVPKGSQLFIDYGYSVKEMNRYKNWLFEKIANEGVDEDKL